uniref:NAD(P)-binding domain-containing protein n=1 Tax=Gasterosteus aculeatus aculeatus TaxID=481459 RepID=A0AAQ4QX39_GASAC
MSNSDRVVLALGGAGTVGSGIVKALLDKGFKVAVISRDSSRLERLQSFVSPGTKDNLTTMVGNVGSEEGAEQAKQDLLKAVGKVTDIVSSLGFSWWQGGPPHTQSLKDLHWVMETLLFSTFVSWKAFFPLVRDDPGSTYSFITGEDKRRRGPSRALGPRVPEQPGPGRGGGLPRGKTEHLPLRLHRQLPRRLEGRHPGEEPLDPGDAAAAPTLRRPAQLPGKHFRSLWFIRFLTFFQQQMLAVLMIPLHSATRPPSASSACVIRKEFKRFTKPSCCFTNVSVK